MDSTVFPFSKKAVALPALSLTLTGRTDAPRQPRNRSPPILLRRRSTSSSSASQSGTLFSRRTELDSLVVDECVIGDEVVEEACCEGGRVSMDPFEQTASLARGLVMVKPTTLLRRFSSRRMTRPPTFFAVLLTAFLYLCMFIRSAVKAKVRSCKHCSGFGIVRCDLCEGHQVVCWEGKYKHIEPCPKCFGKRYVRCSKCSGLFGRSIFNHKTQGRLDAKKLAKLEEKVKADESWIGAPKWVV